MSDQVGPFGAAMVDVPDVVRRAAVRAFWNGVGPEELTAGNADYGLQRAVEAALDAWEQYRQERGL